MLRKNRRVCTTVAAVLILSGVNVSNSLAMDFGKRAEQLLDKQTETWFGFRKPLSSSATNADVVPREAATAEERQFLARGLKAEFVARTVAVLADMIAFWPDDINYTHLIICIEQRRSGTTPGGNGGLNAAVQRVNVTPGPSYGTVETVLHGTARCDGIRTTQWGTVLATEENGADGGAYEIIDPLNTTGHWIADRGGQGGSADIRDGIDSPDASTKVVKRTALAAQSWEGLEVLDNGVVLGGDELRPGDDTDGGAIFRFVPDTFYNCTGAPVRPGQLCQNTITDLSQSPFVAGQNYALATVCSGTGDFGQGCGAGRGVWVRVLALPFTGELGGLVGFLWSIPLLLAGLAWETRRPVRFPVASPEDHTSRAPRISPVPPNPERMVRRSRRKGTLVRLPAAQVPSQAARVRGIARPRQEYRQSYRQRLCLCVYRARWEESHVSRA